MSMKTLNLRPKLFKILSHLATSYHVYSHLIMLYPQCLIEKKSQSQPQTYNNSPHLITSYHTLTTDNCKFSALTPSNVITSCHMLSCFITRYPTLSPIFHRKVKVVKVKVTV